MSNKISSSPVEVVLVPKPGTVPRGSTVGLSEKVKLEGVTVVITGEQGVAEIRRHLAEGKSVKLSVSATAETDVPKLSVPHPLVQAAAAHVASTHAAQTAAAQVAAVQAAALSKVLTPAAPPKKSTIAYPNGLLSVSSSEWGSGAEDDEALPPLPAELAIPLENGHAAQQTAAPVLKQQLPARQVDVADKPAVVAGLGAGVKLATDVVVVGTLPAAKKIPQNVGKRAKRAAKHPSATQTNATQTNATHPSAMQTNASQTSATQPASNNSYAAAARAGLIIEAAPPRPFVMPAPTPTICGPECRAIPIGVRTVIATLCKIPGARKWLIERYGAPGCTEEHLVFHECDNLHRAWGWKDGKIVSATEPTSPGICTYGAINAEGIEDPTIAHPCTLENCCRTHIPCDLLGVAFLTEPRHFNALARGSDFEHYALNARHFFGVEVFNEICSTPYLVKDAVYDKSGKMTEKPIYRPMIWLPSHLRSGQHVVEIQPDEDGFVPVGKLATPPPVVEPVKKAKRPNGHKKRAMKNRELAAAKENDAEFEKVAEAEVAGEPVAPPVNKKKQHKPRAKKTASADTEVIAPADSFDDEAKVFDS